MLSAVGEEIDKVLLLEIGADDYVVKPFGTRELLARIRAVLRRAGSDADRVLTFADVEVNPDRRVVTRKGQEIKFTPAEYNLLTFFLHNPDRPLSRDLILNSVWGYESFPNTRTVDAHVVRLRQKLESTPTVRATSSRCTRSDTGSCHEPSAPARAGGGDSSDCAETLQIALEPCPIPRSGSAPTPGLWPLLDRYRAPSPRS